MTLSVETELPELAVVTIKETAPSSMERLMSGHTFTKARKELADTVSESETNSIDFNPQTLLKSVNTLPSHMRNMI